mgnify:CR=1 FL=1
MKCHVARSGEVFTRMEASDKPVSIFPNRIGRVWHEAVDSDSCCVNVVVIIFPDVEDDGAFGFDKIVT